MTTGSLGDFKIFLKQDVCLKIKINILNVKLSKSEKNSDAYKENLALFNRICKINN